MFNRIEGPMDEHTCALFQYNTFAPNGLFDSTDCCELNGVETELIYHDHMKVLCFE